VAAYTNLEAFLLVPAMLLPLVVWPHARNLWRPLVIVFGLAACLCIPELRWAIDRASSQHFAQAPTGADVREVAETMASAAGASITPGGASLALLWVTAVLWVVGIFLVSRDLVRRGRTNDNFGLAFALSWLLVPPVVSWAVSVTTSPVFSDRYLLVTLPGASIVVAMVLVRLQPRTLGLYGLIYLTVFRFGVLAPSYDKPADDFAGAVHLVAANARPGDCIVFFPSSIRVVYDYYSVRVHPTPSHPGPLPLEVLPDAPPGDNPLVVQYWANYPTLEEPKLITRTASFCPRMWLLVSHAGSPQGAPSAQATYADLNVLRQNLLGSYQRPTVHGLVDMALLLYDRLPPPH